MSLFYRRIIFSGFVLLFCILVPLILIYATGNTINWKRFSLEKTGSVLIDSEPSGATVFLNNEKINDNFLEIFTRNTPMLTKAKISSLAPGEYTVRLEKTGYYSWEEKFSLAPGEVANFGSIGLFNQSQPELVYETSKARAELSPNGQNIALINNNSLKIINVSNGENENIELTNLITGAEINWSTDNKKIALGKTIINLAKQTSFNLAELTKKDIDLIRWSNNEDLIYFVSNKKILRYSLTNKNINELSLNSQLSGQNIVDYLIRSDKIYIITSLNNKQNLWLGSIEEKLNSLDLPTGNYNFKTESSPKPVLTNGKNIYVLDEPLAIFSKPRLITITSNFTIGHWQDNSLTYATALELRRWDNEGQEYLLTRFGSSINNLWPINKRNAIIVATPEDIRVYVNGRQPFAITLAPIKNSQLVTVSPDAKTLYVYGEYEGKEGLFKLAL